MTQDREPRRTTKKLPRLGIEGLRRRLEEAEATLRAIRGGDVDGLVVESSDGTQVYTLKGADQSYRILMEAMNEGAVVLDPSGVIVYANRRVADLVGRPLPEVIGASALEFIPYGHEPIFRDLMERSRERACQQELQIRSDNGRLVPVQLSASSVRFEEKAGICVLVTDLSDQKQREALRVAERKDNEEQIRRQVVALEAANRELEAFVYSVSHDLRAPLRSIHRYGTLLHEEHAGRLDSEARDYLHRMTSAAERMDELIQGLLVYTRISRSEIQLHPVDTSGVLAEVMVQLADDLRQSDAEVRIDRPFPTVKGDALLLSQSLTNLMTNALKFVAPGTRPVVHLWSDRAGPQTRLWVEDNGIGISPQDQARLFRVFERLGGATYPGSGIGLAIVKRAAERMGGSVGVESAPGRGSRFWIALPSLTS